MKINGTPYRTIWLSPDDANCVQIIDQRTLPFKFDIVDVRTPQDMAKIIKEMYVRGAGLIGASAGFGMYLAARNAPDEDFEAAMQEASELLAASRPTARNLCWAVDRVNNAMATGSSPQEKRSIARQTAIDIADEDAEQCRQIGIHGLEIIKEISKKKNGEPVNILTHCNAGWLAFVDFGSATAPIYAARDAGIPIHVWVDETRPWNQGARLTAWELQQEGIANTLICDNCGGHLMQQGMVDMAIVGTDRTTASGDVANKIGTYLKALSAKDNNIPFYVALPSSTIDWRIDDGREIPIEVREADEVIRLAGPTSDGEMTTISLAAPNTKALNYSFDVTPARLITGLITERGVVAAAKNAIAGLFPDKATPSSPDVQES